MNEVFQDYRIVEQITARKYSSLYRAQSLTDPTIQVVIKVFTSSRLRTEQDAVHFLHESAFLKQLQHPHILPLVDAGVARDHPYTIHSYLSAGSLRNYLNSGRLSMQETLRILAQVGEALAYAHEWEVMHGNLKPENILFDTEQRGHAVLTDFMLPDTVDIHQPGYRRDVRSTLYMAPEQFSGSGSADEASDQYAFGCLAYELLTGQVPFAGAAFSTISAKHIKELPAPLSQYTPNIPTALEDAVLKALEKDPSLRYGSVALFLQALTAVSNDQVLSEQIIPTFHIPLSELPDAQTVVNEVETSPPPPVPPIAPISPTRPVSIQWREQVWRDLATRQPQAVPGAPTAMAAPISSLSGSMPVASSAGSLLQTRIVGALTGKMTIPFTRRSTRRWVAFVAVLCIFIASAAFITRFSHATNTSALTPRTAASPAALQASTPTPESGSTLLQPLSTPTPAATPTSTPTPNQPTTPAQPQAPVPSFPTGPDPTTARPTTNPMPTPQPTHRPVPTPTPKPTPIPTPMPVPTPPPTPTPTPVPTPTPTPIPPPPTPVPSSTPVPPPPTPLPTPTPGPTQYHLRYQV